MLDGGAFALLASEMLSRSFQSAAPARRWPPPRHQYQSIGDGVLKPVLETGSQIRLPPPVASISTYQGDGAVKGSRVPSI